MPLWYTDLLLSSITSVKEKKNVSIKNLYLYLIMIIISVIAKEMLRLSLFSLYPSLNAIKHTFLNNALLKTKLKTKERLISRQS